MNHSIYKTDYVPLDWMQNNFASDANDFCSSENIDDCLQRISQEFSALGYPSICSSTSSSSRDVKFDIVTLLNVIFEFIGNCRDHSQIKEDLESRNRQLFTDLKLTNKKNTQLKESLEQAERKCISVSERERQLKEKNNHLSQLIKSEKDESKRLTSQMLQQKVAYQHEVRKHENSMNQMKVRLNQILADKNPDKKIANISSSNLLQRNSKQRGKWKTGSVAKSCVEEMYTSVISSYVNREHDMQREISEFHGCLEYIQSQMLETITLLEGDKELICSFDIPPLQAILNGQNIQKDLEVGFNSLLSRIKETALLRIADSVQKCDEEILSVKSKLIQYEKMLDCRSRGQVVNSEKGVQDSEWNEFALCSECCVSKKELEAEKEKLKKEKLELSATMSLIEKEKADLEVQKLEVIRMALQQEVPKSQWHQNLTSKSSFSVITTKDGLTAVSSTKQLRDCLSTPDQEVRSLTPLWRSEGSVESTEQKSTSEADTQTPQFASDSHTTSTEVQKDVVPSDTDLPKWAAAAMSPSPFSPESQNETIFVNCFSNESIVLTPAKSSEEQSLEFLKAAVEDIEKRRNRRS